MSYVPQLPSSDSERTGRIKLSFPQEIPLKSCKYCKAKRKRRKGASLMRSRYETKSRSNGTQSKPAKTIKMSYACMHFQNTLESENVFSEKIRSSNVQTRKIIERYPTQTYKEPSSRQSSWSPIILKAAYLMYLARP